MQTQQVESLRPAAPADERSLKILAKSVYRELKSSGHGEQDIVGFASALLELVTSELRDQS